MLALLSLLPLLPRLGNFLLPFAQGFGRLPCRLAGRLLLGAFLQGGTGLLERLLGGGCISILERLGRLRQLLRQRIVCALQTSGRFGQRLGQFSLFSGRQRRQTLG